jgi:hypothetical protein
LKSNRAESPANTPYSYINISIIASFHPYPLTHFQGLSTAMAEKAHTGSSADTIVSGVYLQVSVPESKAKEAVNFYKEVFDAEEVGLSCCSKRKPEKEKLYCAELKIGGTSFLVCGDLDDATVV